MVLGAAVGVIAVQAAQASRLRGGRGPGLGEDQVQLIAARYRCRQATIGKVGLEHCPHLGVGKRSPQPGVGDGKRCVAGGRANAAVLRERIHVVAEEEGIDIPLDRGLVRGLPGAAPENEFDLGMGNHDPAAVADAR